MNGPKVKKQVRLK